jgi:hypothetical protein
MALLTGLTPSSSLPVERLAPLHRPVADWVVGAMQLSIDPVLVERRLVGATVSYVVAAERLEPGVPGSVVLRDSFRASLQTGEVVRVFVPLEHTACRPGLTNRIVAVDPATSAVVAGTTIAFRICPLSALPSLSRSRNVADSLRYFGEVLRFTGVRDFVHCIQSCSEAIPVAIADIAAHPELGAQRLRVPPVLDGDGSADGCSDVASFLFTIANTQARKLTALGPSIGVTLDLLAAAPPTELQCA